MRCLKLFLNILKINKVNVIYLNYDLNVSLRPYLGSKKEPIVELYTINFIKLLWE